MDKLMDKRSINLLEREVGLLMVLPTILSSAWLVDFTARQRRS